MCLGMYLCVCVGARAHPCVIVCMIIDVPPCLLLVGHGHAHSCRTCRRCLLNSGQLKHRRIPFPRREKLLWQRWIPALLLPRPLTSTLTALFPSILPYFLSSFLQPDSFSLSLSLFLPFSFSLSPYFLSLLPLPFSSYHSFIFFIHSLSIFLSSFLQPASFFSFFLSLSLSLPLLSPFSFTIYLFSSHPLFSFLSTLSVSLSFFLPST